MTTEIPQAPYIYEGLDPDENADRFGLKKLSAAVSSLKEILDDAKKPGMPLGILSTITREAPLGSIFFAFVLGVAIGRRR